jgi:hypothetical protein
MLTTIYYKPRALLAYAAWLMRATRAIPHPAEMWEGSAEQFQEMSQAMNAEQKYMNVWRWEALAMLFALAWWAGAGLLAHWRRALGIGLLLFVLSLTPGVLGYPTPHTICEALIALSMLAYLGVILALAWLFRACRLASPHDPQSA